MRRALTFASCPAFSSCSLVAQGRERRAALDGLSCGLRCLDVTIKGHRGCSAIYFLLCCHENAVCGKGKLPSWGQLGTQRAFEHAAVPAHDLGLGAATKLPDVFQKSYQRCGRVAWRRDACGPLAVPQTSFSWQKTPKLIAWGRRPDRVSASLQQRVQRFGKFPERPSPRPRCLTCGRVPREGRSRRRRCAGRAGGGAR